MPFFKSETWLEFKLQLWLQCKCQIIFFHSGLVLTSDLITWVGHGWTQEVGRNTQQRLVIIFLYLFQVFLQSRGLRKVVFTWSLAIVTMLLVYETWTFILFVDFVCLFVFYSYHFFMVTWEIYTPEESALWSLSSRLDALAFINSQDVTSLHKSCTRIWTFIKITSDSKPSFFNTFSQIKDFHCNKAALVQWLITCRKTNWRKPDQ